MKPARNFAFAPEPISVRISSLVIPEQFRHVDEVKDADGLKRLAATIKVLGLLRPVTVWRMSGRAKRYHLVAGVRRVRAYRLLKRATIPAREMIITDPMTKDHAELTSIALQMEQLDDNLMKEPKWITDLVESRRKDWEAIAARL